MKPLPRIPDAAPRNVEDVLDYAVILEQFADANSAKMDGERLQEISAHLDVYCGRLYGSARDVIVSGLHKVIGPPPEDSNEAEHYLTKGIFEGKSNGFSVFDAESWEPAYDEDLEQDELYTEFRERLPGKFAISHLVINDRRTIISPDMGLIDNLTFNVVAPFRTNDLLVPGAEAPGKEAARREAMAVISRMDPRSRGYVQDAIEKLRVKGDEPLYSILDATAPINSFLADNAGSLQRDALATIVDFYAPTDLFRTIYQADALPPVYYEDGGAYSIGQVNLPFKQIAFDQLIILDRYFIAKNGSVIVPPETPPGLFLQATTVSTPWGHPLKFQVPAEHLVRQARIVPIGRI